MGGHDGISTTHVDGVRVLWQDLEGPFRAQLQFGVGQAHEPLPLHGVTHLIEHLVLSGSSQAPHAYNGLTGLVTTAFVAAGEPGDVASHLTTVCRNLSDLPVDRLEHERQVLRAEAAQRPGTAGDELALWRWGPVGFGVVSYEELALRWVGVPELLVWTERFSADNAVLWMSKPPPAGLHLPLSPSGTRAEPPALVSPGWQLPGVFPLNGRRGAVLSLLSPRDVDAMPAMWLVQHRLEQSLRHEHGLVYGVTSGNDVLDRDTRHALFAIDCLDESSAQVQDEVCRLLQDLPEPVTDLEWDTFTSQRALWQQVPRDVRAAQYLDSAAQSLLLGRDLEPLEDWEARALAVTREQVSNRLQQTLHSLVLGVTEPARVPAALAAPFPLVSGSRVGGAVLQPSAANPDTSVHTAVVGREGASLVYLNGNTISVHADQVAGALCFDDGTRHLLGTDGFHVRIAPEEWQGAGPALAELDRALPAHVRVAAGSREPSPVQQRRMRPRDMWATVRFGSTRGRLVVALLLGWLALTVALAVSGRPAPLVIGLASWVFFATRERRQVSAVHRRLSDGGS